MTALIKKGTPLPASFTQHFSTFQDNQPGVLVQLFEGEAKLTKDCDKLHDVHLQGIPPAKRGVPQIKVEVTVSEEGEVSTTAEVVTAGVSKNITVKPSRKAAAKVEFVTRASLKSNKDEPGKMVQGRRVCGSCQFRNDPAASTCARCLAPTR
eukprot:COSAG04_NODE_153_length_22436_cov_37.366029_16_plen_152_part_00